MPQQINYHSPKIIKIKYGRMSPVSSFKHNQVDQYYVLSQRTYVANMNLRYFHFAELL